jgi:tetratricopeptide (TPR) repeat protein
VNVKKIAVAPVALPPLLRSPLLLSPLLLLLLLLLGAPAEANPASDALFAEGQTLVAAKRYAEAADKFEAAVAADAKHAAAWYALAAARRRSARCDRAIVAYRRYEELAPTEPEPYYGLGLCLRDTNDRAAAIEALKHYVAVEKRPTSQRWVEHAQSVIVELSAPPATGPAGGKGPVVAAPKPAPVSPGNGAYVEAQALRDKGRIDDAIAKFKQAVALDPRHVAARTALGELLLKIRRDDEAVEVLRVAVEKTPTFPLAWYDLAFAYRARGKMAEAVDAYEHYIKLRPADPDPYYGLGRALLQLGRKAAARQAFATYVAMEKHPSEKRWIDSATTQMQALASAR